MKLEKVKIKPEDMKSEQVTEEWGLGLDISTTMAFLSEAGLCFNTAYGYIYIYIYIYICIIYTYTYTCVHIYIYVYIYIYM